MTLSLSLDWLKTFVTFIESDTIFEAAKKLRMTQPAVSQHLSKLQGFFPSPLFVKSGKKKVLTPMGRELYEKVADHLYNLERSCHIVRSLQQVSSKRELRIGIQRDILFRLGHLISYDGQLQIFSGHSTELVPMLLRNQVDIIASTIVPDSLDIVAHKWFSDEFLLLYPKAWKRKYKNLSVNKILAKEKFVLHRLLFPLLKKMAQDFELDVSDIKIKAQFDEWGSLIRFAERNECGSLIPSSFEIPRQMLAERIPNVNFPKTQFFIIYHRDSRHIPGLMEFLERLKQLTPS